MKDNKNVIILILAILVFAMGGYLFYDHTIVQETAKDEAKKETKIEDKKEEKKEEKEEEKESTQIEKQENSTLTKEQAHTIATEVYKKAYSTVQEGIGFKNSSTNQFDPSKVQHLFTKRSLHSLESRYQAGGDAFINSMVQTIFGATGSGVRSLSIIDYSNDLIIAEGTIAVDCSQCPQGAYCSCPNDTYAHVITFRKEGETWLIDYFD